uniref:Uncharacterized protein n=1 Tax=Anguilla anguilla TaxID=7936 RepID=A0A0E9XWM6_ANGAN
MELIKLDFPEPTGPNSRTRALDNTSLVGLKETRFCLSSSLWFSVHVTSIHGLSSTSPTSCTRCTSTSKQSAVSSAQKSP